MSTKIRVKRTNANSTSSNQRENLDFGEPYFIKETSDNQYIRVGDGENSPSSNNDLKVVKLIKKSKADNQVYLDELEVNQLKKESNGDPVYPVTRVENIINSTDQTPDEIFCYHAENDSVAKISLGYKDGDVYIEIPD